MTNVSALSKISIQHLLCFLAVVEHNGFLAASEQLHVTQSAVSKSIVRLEEALGAPLFVAERRCNRHFRSAELTPEGKYLYEKAAPALGEIAEACAFVSNGGRSEQRQLEIGYTITADADRYLWPLLQRASTENPGIEYNLHGDYRGDLIQGLLDNRFDLVFIPDIEYFSINRTLMEWVYAAVDQAQVLVSEKNALYSRPYLTAKDLEDELFLVFNDGKSQSANKSLYGFFQNAGIDPRRELHNRDAFNIDNVFSRTNGVLLTDSYLLLGKHTPARKIPLKGYYNGILCVWLRSNRKKQIRELCDAIPGDLLASFHGQRPVIQGV